MSARRVSCSLHSHGEMKSRTERSSPVHSSCRIFDEISTRALTFRPVMEEGKLGRVVHAQCPGSARLLQMLFLQSKLSGTKA